LLNKPKYRTFWREHALIRIPASIVITDEYQNFMHDRDQDCGKQTINEGSRKSVHEIVSVSKCA